MRRCKRGQTSIFGRSTNQDLRGWPLFSDRQRNTALNPLLLTKAHAFDRAPVRISAGRRRATAVPLALSELRLARGRRQINRTNEKSDSTRLRDGKRVLRERTAHSGMMRYGAEITAGSLKLQESRVIADLLLRGGDATEWKDAIETENLLQARTRASAVRLARLVKSRLAAFDDRLWLMIRDGEKTLATQAVLAAAIKHSPLLGDFMDLVLREEYRLFHPHLSATLWDSYLEGCRGRDPLMPLWNESTRRRLRSSVFHILAQAGFLSDTRSREIQRVEINPQLLHYLESRREHYTLRCIQLP